MRRGDIVRSWAALAAGVALLSVLLFVLAASGRSVDALAIEPEGSARALTPTPPADGLLGSGPWVVRAYYRDRSMVGALAAWKEPWEVQREHKYVSWWTSRGKKRSGCATWVLGWRWMRA